MPETPEMVERVARAIYGVSAEPEHGETWEALTEVWRDNLRLHARAAIQAMREPTPQMVEAGWPHTADPCWQEDAGKAWSAMVDAALASPEEGRD